MEITIYTIDQQTIRCFLALTECIRLHDLLAAHLRDVEVYSGAG